jgi:hypothetical protein
LVIPVASRRRLPSEIATCREHNDGGFSTQAAQQQRNEPVKGRFDATERRSPFTSKYHRALSAVLRFALARLAAICFSLATVLLCFLIVGLLRCNSLSLRTPVDCSAQSWRLQQ